MVENRYAERTIDIDALYIFFAGAALILQKTRPLAIPSILCE